MLQFQNLVSKFQTSISTFRRYRRFFGNHDIEYGYVDIEVTVFDIEKNVDIVVFDIDVNVDIGGGKVPDGTYDVVRLLPVYCTHDIIHAMLNTTSYVARTMAYVHDVRHCT